MNHNLIALILITTSALTLAITALAVLTHFTPDDTETP